MKQFIVRLSDELAERVQDYASEHSEAPEDALAQLVKQGIDTLPTAPLIMTKGTQTHPLGVNPLENYIGKGVNRYPELTDDEVLAMEAAGELPDDDA